MVGRATFPIASGEIMGLIAISSASPGEGVRLEGSL